MKCSFLLILIFIGCHSPATSPEDASKPGADSDLIKSNIEPDSTPNTFRIHFRHGSDSVSFNQEIDSPRQRQTYIFYAKKGQILDAVITPDTSLANIRFNQIFAPGGAADGPFGLTIHYALNETGDYRLIIAESMMGEEWTGKYSVRLEIK